MGKGDFAGALAKFEVAEQISPHSLFFSRFECLVALKRDEHAATLYEQEKEMRRSISDPESFEAFLNNPGYLPHRAFSAAFRGEDITPFIGRPEQAHSDRSEAVFGTDLSQADSAKNIKILFLAHVGHYYKRFLELAFELDDSVPFVVSSYARYITDKPRRLAALKKV